MKTDRKKPYVSVIICTYNRGKLLKSCLDSIYAQNYPRENFEVIVIDGGSTDETKEVCKNFLELRFVIERKFGLAYARNKGAQLAKGEIVAYTDDDCLVDKDWLNSLIIEFNFSKKIVAVGGMVLEFPPKIIPKNILVNAAFGLYNAGNQAKMVSGIITSNSAFKKEIFNKIKFDESLGVTRKRSLILSGEDTEFCKKIVKSGLFIRYTPSAKVFHRIQKTRVNVFYVLKHAIHYGLSKTRVYLKEKNSRIWAIRFALGQLMQYVLQLSSDLSFTSCYNIVYSLAALCISTTGIDHIYFH